MTDRLSLHKYRCIHYPWGRWAWKGCMQQHTINPEFERLL